MITRLACPMNLTIVAYFAAHCPLRTSRTRIVMLRLAGFGRGSALTFLLMVVEMVLFARLPLQHAFIALCEPSGRPGCSSPSLAWVGPFSFINASRNVAKCFGFATAELRGPTATDRATVHAGSTSITHDKLPNSPPDDVDEGRSAVQLVALPRQYCLMMSVGGAIPWQGR